MNTNLNISNIEPNVNNIFCYWEWNSFATSTLNLLKTCFFSIAENNPTKNIYLFSNSIKYLDFMDSLQADNIHVVRFKYDDIIRNTPAEKYHGKYKEVFSSFRSFSDLFRLLVIWKYGGSYTDLDNLCISSFPERKNILCRCYDWHYGVSNDDCIDGRKKEEGSRYKSTKFSLRNDCIINFVPNNRFIEDMFNMEILDILESTPNIHSKYSWQQLLLDTYNGDPKYYDRYISFNLNLLYIPEGFIYATCPADRYKQNGGEMNDLMNEIDDIDDYPGGKYKCTEENALKILDRIRTSFPQSPLLWMSRKGKMMVEEGDKKYITSWILQNYYNNNFKNI